jgi:hypothetical protein
MRLTEEICRRRRQQVRASKLGFVNETRARFSPSSVKSMIAA